VVSPAVLGQLKSLQTQFEGINAKVKDTCMHTHGIHASRCFENTCDVSSVGGLSDALVGVPIPVPVLWHAV
jgi:hypothetical protein